MRLSFLALFIAVACSFSAQAAAPNDNFANRIPLTGSVLTTGSNVLATAESSEPQHAGQPGGKSVWWSWTAAHNSMVTISTAGSDFDTLLGIYTGNSVASLVGVASNDDASFVETTSLVRFAAGAGTTYHIAVDGLDLDALGADEGMIQLNILDNDDFSDRLSLTGTNVVTVGNNVVATPQAGEPLHAGQEPAHSVWWTWTAPRSGILSLTLSGDNTAAGQAFYKLLAVYTGSSVEGLAPVASNGANFALTNHLQLPVRSGVAYQIAADGVADAAGGLRLELLFMDGPANDNFANRTTIGSLGGTALGSNLGASKESGEPNHAGDTGGSSVWWTWTAPSNGSLSLAVSGTLVSKLVAVYTGPAVTSLTSLRSQASSEPTNRFSLEVVAGTAYAIAVDGAGGQSGTLQLDLQFKNGPANDAFADRLFLTGPSIDTAGSNLGATAEGGEPEHGGDEAQASVWWAWTAPANGSVTVTISGDNTSVGGGPFYKLISIHTGNDLNTLTSVKQSSGLTLTNRAIFDVTDGTIYQIAVDGHDGAQGALRLALQFTAAPANDQFANRILLSGPVVTATGANVAATKETGEPNHGGPGGRSVWWTWTAPANGNVSIATAGSTFNTLLAVYRGTVVTSLTLVANNNDYTGQTSQVTFNAVAGTSYQIAVDGLLQDAGAISLTLSQGGAYAISSPQPPAGGAFQFRFLGQANTNYLIEATTNLTDWLPLLTVTNTIGSKVIEDQDSSLYSLRFYRARLQP